MIRKSILLIPLMFIGVACSKRTSIVTPLEQSSAETHYAELLQMQELEAGRLLCRILDPWRTEQVVAQYLLVPSADKSWNDVEQHRYEEAYGASTLLRTPLQRMTLTTGCHAWLLHELGAIGDLAVMCDSSFVTSPQVKQWLRTHDVKDGGTSMAPNAEVMMQAESDALWISPFENAGTGNLAQLPIPLIYCADYMENSPLARAEWMKFFGRLVDKGPEADSLFQLVATRYDSICHTAEDIATASHPMLLAELPYGPTWYVPGGCSTSARLYQDAGFGYPWAADTHAGSLSLSPEAVLAKAAECDVWYFKYMSSDGDWDAETFLQQHAYYPQFEAAKRGELWGCNTVVSDYFDVTPFRPDLLLESIRNHDERFFKKLRE